VLGPAAAHQPGQQFSVIIAIIPDEFYLLVVIAVLIGCRRQERWAISLIGFSAIVGLVGDSLGALTRIGWPADLLAVAKVCWILVEIGVIAAGALVQPAAGFREAAADRSAYRRGVIPHVCVGVMVLVGSTVLGLRGNLDMVMTISALTVMALLAARQFVAHRENHVLMRQLQDRSEELRASHLRLRHQAEHDPLTGLANRLLFHEVLRQQLGRAPVGVPCGAVLFVDLDDFKNVNDTIGHGAGDSMLRAIADRLRESLRGADVSARLGGDEFAVLLCDATRDDAAAVARRILAALARRIDLDGHMLSGAASIGVAMAVGGDDAGEVLRQADVAMYSSKDAGKGDVAFYHPRMDHNMLAAASLRDELRRALSDGQLVPFFQPIVHLHSGAIVGAEALVRWQHPTRGVVMPNEFIPLAEESGVIVDMGRRMLEASAQQMVRWRETAGLRGGYVSVNISSRHFLDETLAGDVRGVLERSGLPPDGLVIELTESALITDVARVRAQLVELRSMGVRVALDDFGTGYSSLGYLRSLPVDILKIDRTFLADLQSGPQSVEFVRAIATLAQSLDVRAVAEGVEGADQLVVVRSLGIEEAQGYHFSRPLAAVAFQALIESGGRFDLPGSRPQSFASASGG
jgi:diguanylate cyclase (GGDEF)-like protein